MALTVGAGRWGRRGNGMAEKRSAFPRTGERAALLSSLAIWRWRDGLRFSALPRHLATSRPTADAARSNRIWTPGGEVAVQRGPSGERRPWPRNPRRWAA